MKVGKKKSFKLATKNNGSAATGREKGGLLLHRGEKIDGLPAARYSPCPPAAKQPLFSLNMMPIIVKKSQVRQSIKKWNQTCLLTWFKVNMMV